MRMMNFRSVERRDHGYTLVLTGIEGPHLGHVGFVGGLKSGGVPSEIEIVEWTTGTPALMLVHLRYESRNRRQAEQIAAKIVEYQDQYPGRPVNLIGHSGGGGMVLLTLEALPPDRKIDCAILLAAAISPEVGSAKSDSTGNALSTPTVRASIPPAQMRCAPVQNRYAWQHSGAARHPSLPRRRQREDTNRLLSDAALYHPETA